MRAVAVFVAVMMAAGTAHPVFAGEESVGRRVAEIAGSVSTSAVVGPLSIGVRATVPVSDRRDFEIGLDWFDLGYRERSPDQWVLVYYLAQRLMLREGRSQSRKRTFLTFGALGWVDRSVDESLELYYTPIDESPRFHNTWAPPVAPLVGVGHDRSVRRRLRLRGDAQFVWLWGGELGWATVRLIVGASVPLRR